MWPFFYPKNGDKVYNQMKKEFMLLIE